MPERDQELPAGEFASWAAEMRAALRGERGADVPCDGCTACCTSSQFIPIEPDETDTLAHVPPALLFPAPRRPRGHVLLGYDERGHCPMLIDDRCSIYEHRPRACRTYDCRVFSAAALEPDDERKDAIARRARRWRFDLPAEADLQERAAVRAAVEFLQRHRHALPPDVAPATNTQLAVLAVRVSGAFVRHEESIGRTVVVEPTLEAVLELLD